MRTANLDNVRAAVLKVLIHDHPHQEAQIQTLTEWHSLNELGLLSSLTFAGLVIYLERQFGIAIPNQDYTPARFDTLAAITEYIQARQATQS